ncbi:MAG TPA: hypothetical protein VFN51_01945 [Candidatus Saccharimonadales bacterium]|nr:hypothetical protein [Candidatus Saccharimonadales bacterium]
MRNKEHDYLLEPAREIVYQDSDKATLGLLLNRENERRLSGSYSGLTPPSYNGWYHGRAFDWDHMKHIIIWGRNRTPESLIAGQTEYGAVFAGQCESGKVPNQRLLYGKKTFEAKITGSKESNFYSQPPMGSIGGVEFINSMTMFSPEAARDFLDSIYDNLYREATYWPKHRQNGPDDKRLGVVSGEETGMDESPIFDHQLPFKRLARNGLKTPTYINVANMAIHFAGRMWLDRKRRGLREDQVDPDEPATHKGLKEAREIFWVMPVQMQSIVCANLYSFASLADLHGKNDDALEARGYADSLASQVVSDVNDPENPGMWDPSARGGRGMFRDLDRNGKPIDAHGRFGRVTEEVTASSLCAILLPNLTETQLLSVVDMAVEEFLDDYGLSTVGKGSPNYDPDHRELESGRWRGPGWLDQPWIFAEGLTLHINRNDISQETREKCQRLLCQLRDTSLKALEKWHCEGKPVPEYYSHRTGRPFRLYKVRGFGWNNLGYVMPPDERPSFFSRALLANVHYQETDEELAA